MMIMLHFIVRCCVVLSYCIVLFCIVLYSIVLYCIVLYCIVLLYCTVFLASEGNFRTMKAMLIEQYIGTQVFVERRYLS